MVPAGTRISDASGPEASLGTDDTGRDAVGASDAVASCDGAAAGWRLETTNPKTSVPTTIATLMTAKPASRRAEIAWSMVT
jgi:hypothetical protein